MKALPIIACGLAFWPAVAGGNTCIAPKPVRVRGLLCGRVFDPTGTVVPKVSLKVSNAKGELVKQVDVDDKGDFQFSDLPKGSYRLDAATPGWMISFGAFEMKTKNRACTHPVSVYLGVGSCQGGIEKKRPPHYR